VTFVAAIACAVFVFIVSRRPWSLTCHEERRIKCRVERVREQERARVREQERARVREQERVRE
jgi:hypothetical protein